MREGGETGVWWGGTQVWCVRGVRGDMCVVGRNSSRVCEAREGMQVYGEGELVRCVVGRKGDTCGGKQLKSGV